MVIEKVERNIQDLQKDSNHGRGVNRESDGAGGEDKIIHRGEKRGSYLSVEGKIEESSKIKCFRSFSKHRNEALHHDLKKICPGWIQNDMERKTCSNDVT